MSFFGIGVVADVDLEAEGRMGANCGGGRPEAAAEARAASWESMRW